MELKPKLKTKGTKLMSEKGVDVRWPTSTREQGVQFR